MSNAFTWKTRFKSIIIVDGELFANEYKLNVSLTPHTASLKEQTEYFERLKNLFEQVFANTVTTWREEKLYSVLRKNSTNRFIELPKPPYDQIMAAVCFCKANSILDSKITKVTTLSPFPTTSARQHVKSVLIQEWDKQKF